MQEIKLAEKLRLEYKVPDRRFWWLRLKALAELEEWAEMEKFSKLKKSPIGYEPFVDICLEYGNRYEAQKYIARISDELKVKYYVKVNMLEQAAQVAFEQKDHEALMYVQSNCGPDDKNVTDKVNSFLAQLNKKK